MPSPAWPWAAAAAAAVGAGALLATPLGPAALVAGLCAGACASTVALVPAVRPAPPAALPPRTDVRIEALDALDALRSIPPHRLPAPVAGRVAHLDATVRDALERLDDVPSDADAHTVVRTATHYLPAALAGYLRLPRDFADHHRVRGHDTALSLVCAQLDLLSGQLDRIVEAACAREVDDLATHGRFLGAKFTRPAPGATAPWAPPADREPAP